MEETLLNERGVLVSTARLDVKGHTYSTANITSVRLAKTSGLPAGILLTLLGLGVGFIGRESGGCALAAAAVLVFCGVCYMAFGTSATLFVTTAAQEQRALKHNNVKFVERVAEAVKQAIVRRG